MTKQELEDALDSLQETINQVVTERAADRAAIREVKERLVTARHLLKENWSGKDEWWIGNEHTWSAQADDEIRKALAAIQRAQDAKG